MVSRITMLSNGEETILKGASRTEGWNLPIVYRTDEVPDKLIPFDKALRHRGAGAWVHFYIEDYRFKRLLNNPQRYLPMLSRHQGVIAPDFSVCWNEPLYRQLDAVATGREVASWLQRNGVPTIPNLRWGKPETYPFVFDGVEPGGTVAVGTLACMKSHETRTVFGQGLAELVKAIRPKTIVVYGSMDESSLRYLCSRGVSIKVFKDEMSAVHGKMGKVA